MSKKSFSILHLSPDMKIGNTSWTYSIHELAICDLRFFFYQVGSISVLLFGRIWIRLCQMSDPYPISLWLDLDFFLKGRIRNIDPEHEKGFT